ncbi:MAG: hypothetical protein BWK76_12125 [Desulfobulbaceae bacterium A2]|nr:MAG: hypothetical protein BWK76_12125 [Desulfobulbaceae bacterium A2]
MKRTILTYTLLLCCCVLVGVPRARAEEELRFAYQNRIGDAVTIVAVSKNLFAAEGLHVKAMQFNNGPACAEALVTGGVDIATMGDTAAVLSLTKDSTLRILGSHGAGEQRHRIIVPQHNGIRHLTDLKGKRVAVKKGTSTYGGFLALLATHAIKPTELTIIDLDPGLMPEALAAGSLDAFVASEPTPSQAELRGGRALAHLGGMGNNYPLLLLAKTRTLDKRSWEMQKFFRALQRAERFIRQHPEETIAILGKETGLPVAIARAAMERHSYHVQLDAPTMASLHQIAAFLLEQKKIQQLPDIDGQSTDRFIENEPGADKDAHQP